MSSTDGNSIVTYSLVYSFLTERSHFRAAEAVKKAAKDIVIIKSSGRDGPTLPVIVKQWKKFTADQGKKVTFPYVLYQPLILVSDSRTTSDRSDSTRSESSGFDSDSDCMDLVRNNTFRSAYIVRPSQLRRIQKRAQRKPAPKQVCAVFPLVVTKPTYFWPQTSTQKPTLGHSKAINILKRKPRLNRTSAPQSRRPALNSRPILPPRYPHHPPSQTRVQIPSQTNQTMTR